MYFFFNHFQDFKSVRTFVCAYSYDRFLIRIITYQESLFFTFCLTIKLFLIFFFSDECPDGWKNLKDSCYFFADYAQASFSEAEDVCGDLDAHFIVIHSLEEYDFLHNSLKGKIIWLGIRRRLDLPSSRRQLNGNKVNFNEVSENKAHRFVANHYSHCGSRKHYICVEAHWREWHLVM